MTVCDDDDVCCFQAYTVELESLVTILEEENARLLKEEVCFLTPHLLLFY